jgi:hypothetical protein
MTYCTDVENPGALPLTMLVAPVADTLYTVDALPTVAVTVPSAMTAPVATLITGMPVAESSDKVAVGLTTAHPLGYRKSALAWLMLLLGDGPAQHLPVAV